ncbi:MAG TPA: Zn-ribbon domain-containing OB-fold protein [Candidatus Lokiarchaeia archaeon]|nr:Zn-ribbon domain-containing OB-fold protein [Candidatus Lokiarchaeia archaeon]
MADPAITVKNYKQFLAEEKLMGSKCGACGNIDLPARPLCSKCTSPDVDWVEMAGTGTIAAFTTIHVGTTFFKNQGYDMNKPYAFCIVETPEGPCVSAQLVGVDESTPAESIQIGMPVKVKFLHSQENDQDRVDLGFEPA